MNQKKCQAIFDDRMTETPRKHKGSMLFLSANWNSQLSSWIPQRRFRKWEFTPSGLRIKSII